MSRHMTERTTVRLPEELVRRAKRKAAAEGRTLTSLIEDGLRNVLDERARKGGAKRKPLPVSSATGGLKPGIDWNFRDLEEMEDIERMRRIAREHGRGK